MSLIWRYIIMALCFALTLAKVMNYHGNRKDLHDNVISGVKEEKVLTPPSSDGFDIDSNGYPGNSNDMEKDKNNNEVEKGASFLKKIITILQDQSSELKDYQLIAFDKEDFDILECSELCKVMCSNGVVQPLCKCK